MTKIASKLATGLAILSLAAPALAATTSATGAPQIQTAKPKHHQAHRRVAQADQKKAGEKKAAKKGSKKHSASAPKTEVAPKTETAPAPAK